MQFDPEIAGTVSQYEEREAARYCGYSWPEWQRVPRDERIDSVGYYRLNRLIELHIDDINERDMRMRQHRQRKKAGV